MQISPKTFISPEDYLARELNSEERHHYFDGEIVKMAGGTPNHNVSLMELKLN